MSSPYANSVISTNVPKSGQYWIDDIIVGTRWGTGGPVTLSMSFPWSGGGYAWFDDGYGNGENNAPIRYGLSPAQIATVEQARTAWTSVANVKFITTTDTQFNVGDIRIAWTSAPVFAATTYSAPIFGTFTYYPSTKPSGGDIWLNPDHYYSGGAVPTVDLVRAIGYSLGIVDTKATGFSADLPVSLNCLQFSIQSLNAYPGFENSWVNFEPTTPMLFDIAAAQYLYGANFSFHSENNTYTFYEGHSYFQTIWDGGGIDTIVWSAKTEGAVISLNAGDWSDLGNALIFTDQFGSPIDASYTATNMTVAIAYGVTIENATGGDANDTLRGNDGINILIGGGGDDYLRGDGGDDTLNGGTGIDTVDYRYAPSSVNVSLAQGSAAGGEGVDRLISIENVLGSDFRDTITGDGSSNSLYGLGGDDLVSGGGGADRLQGGEGDDSLSGGADIDTAIFDGNFNDYVITYVSATGTFTVRDKVVGRYGTDTAVGIEQFKFSDVTKSAASLVELIVSGSVAARKSAGQIFQAVGEGTNEAGLVRVMADFAKAAYDLQWWEDSTINDYSPNSTQAKAMILAQGWVPLSLSVKSLPPTSIVSGQTVTNKMSNGYFTNGNAAALVAVSTDSVVISFRGTNDNAEAFSPNQNPSDGSNRIHPDKDQWGPFGSTMADHFAEFSLLFQALTEYVNNPTNGIRHVYVTGHSLGGAMALEFMHEHKGDASYEAVTFAAPPFTTSSHPFGAWYSQDSRIIQVEINEDPVPATALATTRPGKQILFDGSGTDDTPDFHLPLSGYYNDDNHSMDYYWQITKSIDASSWARIIDDPGDLRVLIGSVSGPNISSTPVRNSPTQSGDQFDSYYIVDGFATGYVRNQVVSGFLVDNNASAALSGGVSSVQIGDGINVSLGAILFDDQLSAKGKSYDVYYGGRGEDLLVGGGDSELILGGAGNDRAFGWGGSDVIVGGQGDDYLDGGAGIDAGAYSGARANFKLTNQGAYWSASDLSLVEGGDKLVSVERLQFADTFVALDLDGHAGQAAQVIRALFGPAMLKQEPIYAGYGITLLDQGITYSGLVSVAIHSDAFLNLAHSRSDVDFVKLVYKNVVGSLPAQGDLDYFVGLLKSGAFTQESLGVLACESIVNSGSVDLVGLATTGLDYIVPPELG